MKELEKEFDGRGSVRDFHFRQIMGNEFAYIYEVTQPDVKNPHYEVFCRVEQKEKTQVMGANTVFFEAKVRYPFDEAFGSWAWCIGDKESAIAKFEYLTSMGGRKGLTKNQE